MQSDEELMSAVAKGDLIALDQLVRRHQASAWNLAYRLLGHTHEAEDVAQEAFLRLLQAAGRYRPTASFRTFLYRIVTPLCLDRRRKAGPSRCANPDAVIQPAVATLIAGAKGISLHAGKLRGGETISVGALLVLYIARRRQTSYGLV